MRLSSAFKFHKWIGLFLKTKFGRMLPDKTFIKLEYYSVLGKHLNLKKPQTYNEKLQWLKLYDRNPLYTVLVDKYKVKQYVANIIGEEYIIPTLGVWDNPEEIDFDSMPNQFVLKVTHDSGGLVICKDKEAMDKDAVIKRLKLALARDYYLVHREWPYKNVPKKIIAEQYMEDSKTSELRDYKFFCFDGKVKLLFIASNRQNEDIETTFDFFDVDFNHIDLRNGHPNATIPLEKPKNFELMKQIAESLSKDIPHVRVDFYEVNQRVYFGEMTFSHWSGLVNFEPEEWDKILGSWVDLRKNFCMENKRKEIRQ